LKDCPKTPWASCRDNGQLHIERQTEAEGVAQLFDLTGSGAFAKHLLDRIAGNEVDEQKNQGQDQPKGRQGKQEAMQKMAGHSSADQRSFSRDFGFEVVRTEFDDSLAASLSVGRER
jgi:hypothetical protein